MLAFGIVCAMLEARQSGKGQVIDAAICDGAATLSTGYHGMLASGRWVNQRQSNLLDGGAHFYGCYTCSDGKYISIGSIEPAFYEQLLDLCGIQDEAFRQQWERGLWPELRARLETLFAGKTRDEWCELLEGTDVCFAPVLDFEEARSHPHNVARNAFIETSGIVHPAPSPRFSRTPAEAGPIPVTGSHTEEVLKDLGRSPDQIAQLREQGTIA